jgi:membrane protein
MDIYNACTAKISMIFKCLINSMIKTIDHDGVEHAGYMAFMVILSIFPFIVFFLALTSFLGASELGQEFVQMILLHLPELATESIKNRIMELGNTPPLSLMTLAIVGTIWTSSSFVEGLRTILNRVYGITSPPPYIYRRLMSILQFFLINIMITFAMLLFVFIPIGISKIDGIQYIIGGYEQHFKIVRYILIFISLFLGVSSLYYIIPNATINFINVIPGAFITVVLWMLGGRLLSKYILYYNQLSVVYGSLGSVIVTLIFFYIINLLFIYGAEFNNLIFRKGK